jgi:two-component system response regulator PilR (NtrC family)
MARILIAEDEESMRDLLQIFLKREGHYPILCSDGAKAISAIQSQDFDLILTDIKMPKNNGLAVLKAAKQKNPQVPVIMITAYASQETAIEAMKEGAFDYITKPFKVEEMRLVIANALRSLLPSEKVPTDLALQNIIGKSPAMLKVFELIQKVAAVESTILITGESGTGKELVARAIHQLSNRNKAAFVTVNCGAIPENLLESELFGHVKGSFTGAIAHKKGIMEMAQGGTCFLDEVGELPLPLQVKILRTLQDKTFMRVGGTEEIKVDIRLIAATNKDLGKAAEEGKFREDLYYRLNVIPIPMPPLRERKEDIPLLASHFLDKYSRQTGKKILGLSYGAQALLSSYHWPGNVRELENAMERAVALESGEHISVPSIAKELSMPEEALVCPVGEAETPLTLPLDLENHLAEIEKKYLLEALEKTQGVQKEAAKLLNLSFRSFRHRLQKHKIKVKKD